MAPKSVRTLIYGTLVITMVSFVYLLFPQILTEIIGGLFLDIGLFLLAFAVVVVVIMITQSSYDRRNYHSSD